MQLCLGPFRIWCFACVCASVLESEADFVFVRKQGFVCAIAMRFSPEIDNGPMANKD